MPSDTVIKSCAAACFDAPLRQVFSIATGSHSRMENVLFSVELSSGAKGYGEAAPAPHITGETQARTLANLNKAAQQLKGLDCANYLSFLPQLYERLPGNHCAAAAVEMAVLGALCEHSRVPLYKFFGSRRARIASDMTVVLGSVEEAGRDAALIRARGITRFKIKLGGEHETDFLRILAVHKAAPRGVIYLDANQSYSSSAMLKLLSALKRAGVLISALEQPVPQGDWEGLARVTRMGGVCVIADESVQSQADAVRIIRTHAAHAVNIKTAKFGLLRGAEMARLCAASGVKLMIGGMMESAVAMAASAHLAGGLGCFDFIDLDTPLFIRGKMTAGPAGPSSDGIYHLEKVKTGLGVSPVASFAA